MVRGCSWCYSESQLTTSLGALATADFVLIFPLGVAYLFDQGAPLFTWILALVLPVPHFCFWELQIHPV
jgi:hypothetical protein